jgi:hypothetical protein
MTKVKKLIALFSFLRLPDDSFVSRLTAIHDAMLGNTAYPAPPIDLATFKTAITNYAASVVAALDGSKRAIGNKKKLREVVVKMAEQLGHYVEANCNEDPVTFTSSGFEIRQTVPLAPQPLAQPTVESVDQGKTGELRANVTPVEKARMYEVRIAPLGPGGAPPTTWITVPAASARKPIAVENLTPGTTYVFQVRAYGTLGYTDWSPAYQRMCI